MFLSIRKDTGFSDICEDFFWNNHKPDSNFSNFEIVGKKQKICIDVGDT